MILLVAVNFPPEQIVAACINHDLAEYLSCHHQVKVLSPKPSRPKGFDFGNLSPEKHQYEHIILDSYTCPDSRIFGRFRESFSFGMHVRRYIQKNHDSIQCCYVHSWPLISQYIIIKTLKFYSIPSTVHIQDVYPESLVLRFPVAGKFLKMILLPIDRYILQNSAGIIAISENMKKAFLSARGVHPGKITIVPNWKNEEDFMSSDDSFSDKWRVRVSDGSFVFMYLGNIGPVAGVELLIRSFVHSKLSGSELIIAGCGPSREKCIRLAESYNQPNIKFWDVPAGEVPAVQKIADVMLLPVRSGASMSSVPSKLLAYMFSGKPVIACVDGGSDTAAAVEESGCGWVVIPDNIEALSLKMKNAAGELRENLHAYGQKGFNYAVKNYSVRKNLPLLATVITGTAYISDN